MPITKAQMNRLAFIDAELKKGRFPNCSSIAEEYGVSTKTVQRDIEYMKINQNAPIEYDTHKHGYYYSEKSFSLPMLSMSESEAFAVLVADKALANYANTPVYPKLASVFKKIGEFLPDTITLRPAWTDPQFSFFHEPMSRIDSHTWNKVAESLHEEVVLNITYRDASGKTTVRDIEPYHVVNYRGEWYLIAFCQKKDGMRTFAVSRIVKAEVTDYIFVRPDDFDINEYMGDHFGIIRSEKTYKVEIMFNPECAGYIKERDWHQTQEIRERRDGSLVLTLTVNDLQEVKHWVMSWGANAKVLSPKDLADEIKGDIGKLVEVYGK